MPIDYALYFVADAEFASGRDLVPVIEAAVRGGVTVVQLRAKDYPFQAFVELGRRAAAILKKRRVPLLINDRVDVALACGAAGIHLGQKDMPPALARRALRKGSLIGISVNTPEEAREAENQGADYVGAGPAYATTTITTGLPVLGPDGIRRIKDAVRIPVVAIGGITDRNARAVRRAGADGVAVVSAILSATDPERAARQIKKSFRGLAP
ncbi:MAG: thiamine phosphate synthase [Candidatus Aminicenantales bacterium]|jgi:thiamine-phosphate pyrophosphorylase